MSHDSSRTVTGLHPSWRVLLCALGWVIADWDLRESLDIIVFAITAALLIALTMWKENRDAT